MVLFILGEVFEKHKLSYDIVWKLSGNPFLTRKGLLVDAVVKSCQDILGTTPELSTSGGTSDGRFIAPTGTEVVELGPCNDSIHQINENVEISDPEQLARTYKRILEIILTESDQS